MKFAGDLDRPGDKVTESAPRSISEVGAHRRCQQGKSSFRKKNNRNSGRGQGKSSTRAAHSKCFQQLMRAGDETRKKFHATTTAYVFGFNETLVTKAASVNAARFVSVVVGTNPTMIAFTSTRSSTDLKYSLIPLHSEAHWIHRTCLLIM